MRYQTVDQFLGDEKSVAIGEDVYLQRAYPGGPITLDHRSLGLWRIAPDALVDTENLVAWAEAACNDFVPDGSREVPPIEDPEQNDFIPDADSAAEEPKDDLSDPEQNDFIPSG